MSINAIINSGLSAILANQAALRTTASNISNVNTPDYVRRVVNFESQTSGNLLGGVNVASVERAVDQYLNGQRWQAAAGQGEASAADRFLDQLQASMGGVQDKRDPASRLAAMSAGLAQLSADPTSAVRRAELVGQMKSFADSVSELSAKAQSLRSQADQEIGEAVKRINALTKQIAELNGPIQRATLAGDTATPLRDQRDAAVRELAGLIDIRVDENASGRVTVTTPTGFTLAGDHYAEITHTASPPASPGSIYPDLTIQRRSVGTGAPIGDAEPMARHIAGGELRGLMDVRDTTLPNLAAEIGAFAAGTAEAYNAAHNASTAYPPPATLTGRNTGLLASDTLGFTGRASVAVVSGLGALSRRVDVDFDAGTLSVDGGAAVSIGSTIGSFVTALNTALGGQGNASFANGVLSVSASGGNGVAIQQDAANPADRAGRGLSHAFGLNDVFEAPVSLSAATGLSATDAHGFTAGQQIGFTLRNADGSVARSFTYTVGGTSVGDVVTGLNAAAAGTGTFALDGDGRLTFAASNSNQRLEIAGDGTQRGGTGISLSGLFALGRQSQMAQSNIAVRPSLMQSPGRLALGQLDLTGATAGSNVLTSADNRGVLALQAAGVSGNFAAAGFSGPSTQSLASQAAALVASIGQRAAAATAAADDAASYKGDIDARALAKEGVNLDEELAAMMMFQQAYNAGARIITTAQRLYDELLQLVR